MTTNSDNDTMYQMGGIFAGIACAAGAWYYLAQSIDNLAIVILAIFIFCITSWSIYEAFAEGDDNEEPFGKSAFSPTASPMGLTDRDAWTRSAPAAVSSAKVAPAKKAAPAKTVAKTAKAPAKTVTKTAKAPAKKAASPKKAAGPVRLKKAKGKADDLKLISGVGPKLEKTLNGLGFWHFSQIADWKKSDVAIVDDQLSFKGRIERDDWIKQAKKLAKKKA